MENDPIVVRDYGNDVDMVCSEDCICTQIITGFNATFFDANTPHCWYVVNAPPCYDLKTGTVVHKSVLLMVCRNICEKLYSKVVFGISNYSLGQKYCRRCEVYMYNDSMFCPCCGMQLRLTPSSRKCKEILRKRKAVNAEMVDN
jgi:hypothetical protein